MSAGCVWSKLGQIVTETRLAWKSEYPRGGCEKIVQYRNCTCGKDCGQFAPNAFSSCTSGCGTTQHGEVTWSEERTRFAQPLSRDTCRSQVQKRGAICQGTFGGIKRK